MKTQLLKILYVIVAAAAMVACASTPTAPEPEQYSGFLSDYSRLQEATAADGVPVMRWISPKLTAETYNKVMIDPVQFHPEPQPSEQVNTEVLAQIRDYFDTVLRERMSENYTLVDQPGPGVVRLRPAITGVVTSREALKAYQYLPIGLIFTAAREATGTRPEQVVVAVEAELLDSQTGEQLGAVVRTGTGESLKGSSDQLTLSNVQPVLDHWADLAATQTAGFVRPTVSAQ